MLLHTRVALTPPGISLSSFCTNVVPAPRRLHGDHYLPPSAIPSGHTLRVCQDLGTQSMRQLLPSGALNSKLQPYGWSPFTGEAMVPVSWQEMMCPSTQQRQKRKVAKVV